MRVTAEQIIAYVERIAAGFSPERIILFGSYARGSPTADSDVDLLVVMPYRGSAYQTAAEISLKCGHPFAMDMLVRSQHEINHRISLNDWFIREIVEEGVVLHDSADKRVGGQGRRRLKHRLARIPVSQVA